VRYGEGPVDAKGKMAGLPMGALNKPQADFRFGAGDFRFTVGKDGAVYAFALERPKGGETVKIVSMGTKAGLLAKPVAEVTLLGSDEKVKWEQKDGALEITYPKGAVRGGEDMAVVFRVR
jgi:alpha-L-fucosidase